MTEINMNKHRVKKKYKRYHNNAALAGTGRDTAHREMAISEDEMRIRWCITWHHDHWDWALQMCKKCGTTYEEKYPFTGK